MWCVCVLLKRLFRMLVFSCMIQRHIAIYYAQKLSILIVLYVMNVRYTISKGNRGSIFYIKQYQATIDICLVTICCIFVYDSCITNHYHKKYVDYCDNMMISNRVLNGVCLGLFLSQLWPQTLHCWPTQFANTWYIRLFQHTEWLWNGFVYLEMFIVINYNINSTRSNQIKAEWF